MMCGWHGALSSFRAVCSNKLHKTKGILSRSHYEGELSSLLNSPLAWDPEHQVLGTGIFLMPSAKPNWFASPDCMALSHRFCEGWQCDNIICKTLRTATVLLDGSKASAGGTSILEWRKERASSFSPPCRAGSNLCSKRLRKARFCPCCPVVLRVHPSHASQCSVVPFIPTRVYMLLTAASRFVCCHNTHCTRFYLELLLQRSVQAWQTLLSMVLVRGCFFVNPPAWQCTFQGLYEALCWCTKAFFCHWLCAFHFIPV